MFLLSCVTKILRNRESNIREFKVEYLLDDNDEDAPLIQ
jgi:hypothetical protein